MDVPQDLWSVPHRAHLVGIAGCGMRALADVLLQLGWHISGSDPAAGEMTAWSHPRLVLYPRHAAANVPPDADVLIFSDAVPPENPELQRAAALGIPQRSYFQTLGRLMQGKRGLAVAGTHGKSTATAMAAAILTEAGRDPTVVCGASPLGERSGGRLGQGDSMLVEACEYRANFLNLRPQQAAILGIEPDHFDCYPTAASLEAAFAQFAQSLPSTGLLLVRHECRAARRAASAASCPVETFGLTTEATWSARRLECHRGRWRFELYGHGQRMAEVALAVPGLHNAVNAVAAAALASANGASTASITSGLQGFRGLQRRLEFLGVFGGIAVMDDYAHHPTEVSAGLRTAREMFPARRICCVFQPHQVSRTVQLLDELAESLDNADMVLVADVYRAREGPPRPGEVTAADLAAAVRGCEGKGTGSEPPEPSAASQRGCEVPVPFPSQPLRARGSGQGPEVPPVHEFSQIAQWVAASLRPGDVLLTMGAGDVRKVADGFVDGFRENRAAG